MFQVLVAQSSHRYRIESCIHRGMEIRFCYDTQDCFREMLYSDVNTLVLKDNLEIKEKIDIREILTFANHHHMTTILISQELSEEVMELLFHYNVHHYFMEPVLLQDVFDKLEMIKGNEEVIQMEKKAGQLLHTLGIPNSVQGYKYLLDAIVSCCCHEDYMKGITKKLYPLLADRHNTSSCAVEKSIRHAIEMAFSHSDQSMLYDFFKGTIRSDKAKATNSQFISMCVNHIKKE